MGVIFSDVLKFLRIIERPFSPELPNNESNFSALKVTYLLLLHIFSCLFIFISGKRSVGVSVGNGIGTRAIAIVFVVIGITSLVVLVIRGCQNKLTASCTALTRMSDPSLDLQIIFFMDLRTGCYRPYSNKPCNLYSVYGDIKRRERRGALSVLSSITLLVNLLLQISIIIYYQYSTFVTEYRCKYTYNCTLWCKHCSLVKN